MRNKVLEKTAEEHEIFYTQSINETAKQHSKELEAANIRADKAQHALQVSGKALQVRKF